MGQLYQRYLNRCKQSGVDWRPDTRYIGLHLNNDQLVVRLVSQGAACEVKTRFIVGADGANSRVARDLNLDRNSEWIVGLECVFTNVPLNGPPRLHCFLDPQLSPGYLAWIADDGEETHVGVGGYPSRFEPAVALQAFLSSINGIVDLSRARLIERRGGRIPVGGVLPRIANECGLLVGDAAGAVSPFTAGGLDPCLRLSNYAAQIIAAYLKTGDKRVLDSYSGELFRARFASRLWMRRLISVLDQRSVIEFCCRALRLTPLKWVAWHVFFGRGSFPDTCVPTAEAAPLKVRAAS
jgi:flavin-dependent dehydrogenase